MTDKIVTYDELLMENAQLHTAAARDGEALMAFARQQMRAEGQQRELRIDNVVQRHINTLQRVRWRRARILVKAQWLVAMLAGLHATRELSVGSWWLFFVALCTAAAGGFLFSKTLTSPHAPERE